MERPCGQSWVSVMEQCGISDFSFSDETIWTAICGAFRLQRRTLVGRPPYGFIGVLKSSLHPFSCRRMRHASLMGFGRARFEQSRFSSRFFLSLAARWSVLGGLSSAGILCILCVLWIILFASHHSCHGFEFGRNSSDESHGCIAAQC